MVGVPCDDAGSDREMLPRAKEPQSCPQHPPGPRDLQTVRMSVPCCPRWPVTSGLRTTPHLGRRRTVKTPWGQTQTASGTWGPTGRNVVTCATGAQELEGSGKPKGGQASVSRFPKPDHRKQGPCTWAQQTLRSPWKGPQQQIQDNCDPSASVFAESRFAKHRCGCDPTCPSEPPGRKGAGGCEDRSGRTPTSCGPTTQGAPACWATALVPMDHRGSEAGPWLIWVVSCQDLSGFLLSTSSPHEFSPSRARGRVPGATQSSSERGRGGVGGSACGCPGRAYGQKCHPHCPSPWLSPAWFCAAGPQAWVSA